MKYAVYQINADRDTQRLLFVSYERTMNAAGKVPMEIYDKVYEGEIQPHGLGDEYTLEVLYEELNIHRDRHPEFRGHSLSVSDVVELEGSKWFCDSIGWRRIEM